MAGFCATTVAQRLAAAIVVTNFSLVWEQIVVAALPGGVPAEGDKVPGLSVEADYHRPLHVPQPPAARLGRAYQPQQKIQVICEIKLPTSANRITNSLNSDKNKCSSCTRDPISTNPHCLPGNYTQNSTIYHSNLNGAA